MEATEAAINENRRDIKTRDKAWAQRFAAFLASQNISPNQISVLSMLFAGLALAAFVWSRQAQQPAILILAVVSIQLRLLCNLFDGMVAVEFNKKSAVGEIFNEVPDRISDTLIILGAGLYCQNQEFAVHLAWANIFLATMTAYVRVFGAALGKGHRFLGPMAKQHRMFLISLAAVGEWLLPGEVLYISLWIMFILLVATVTRRLVVLSRSLQEAP